MGKTETLSDKSVKERLIIEVAQKRFGMFGLEKTSMREIADDLKLSKASLYYYFPDKESLYRAVIEKEQAEFTERMMQKILNIEEPGQVLREYANSRLSYFRTLLNLSRLRFEVYSDLKPSFIKTFNSFKEKEKEIIVRIIRKGTSDGIFFTDDEEMAASLFLDLLRGLRISILNDKKALVIRKKEFDQLIEKTNAFTEIFIRGLKCQYE